MRLTCNDLRQIHTASDGEAIGGYGIGVRRERGRESFLALHEVLVVISESRKGVGNLFLIKGGRKGTQPFLNARSI
jgi:hypothetical protein